MGERKRRFQLAGSTALVVAFCLFSTGCGGERSFAADEVVEELSAAGTELSLGEKLPSAVEGSEVRVVNLEGSAAAAGTLVILPGAEEAQGEFNRCQSAISFVCFRAANAVLRFTGIGPGQEAQIAASLKQMETTPES